MTKLRISNHTLRIETGRFERVNATSINHLLSGNNRTIILACAKYNRGIKKKE
jgi:hypothetical protein